MFGDLEETLTDVFDEFVSIKIRRQKERPGNRLTFGEISANGLEGTSLVRGQAFVLEREDLDFPRFQYLPRLRSPATYHLHTWATEPTGVLFTSELREWFSKNAGWRVRGRGQVLVIYRLREARKLDDSTFVKTAQQICRLFRAGEHELDLRPEVSREATPEQILKAGQGLAPAVMSSFKATLKREQVTAEEMSDFCQQSTPRSVPPGMKRQVIGRNYFLECVGAGLLLMTVGALSQNHETAEHFGAGAFIGTLGIVCIAYPIWKRARKMRVLRDGIATRGEVFAVKRANMSVNNRQIYRVGVMYEADGVEQTCYITTFREQADRARRQMDSETAVEILYDPHHPRQAVCLDLVFVY